MLVDEASPSVGVRPRAAPARRSLLLLEPFFVLRQTVTSVASDLNIAKIHQALSLEAALQLAKFRRFDGFVLSLGEEQRELELIRALRAGETESLPTIPVAIMTAECDAGTVLVLRDLQVSRILLKPFKVKSILDTISQMVEGTPLSR
jgi:DNA-binding NarL/FixJ family response regulator